MQSTSRFFDDMARVAGGAMNMLGGVRQEIDVIVRQRLQRLLDDMDLVPREEFEAVRAMAETARLEQERLAEKIVALEARLEEAGRPAPRKRQSPSTRRKRKAESEPGAN